MPTTPDIAGFTDAMQRLRSQFGEDVVFLGEASVTFPDGTPIDPENGWPYDPTIRPIASGQASATVKCDIFFRSLPRGGGAGEASQGPAGIRDDTLLMLIADISDRDSIDMAQEFVARGDRFKIEAKKADGIGGIQRYLVYGKQK